MKNKLETSQQGAWSLGDTLMNPLYFGVTLAKLISRRSETPCRAGKLAGYTRRWFRFSRRVPCFQKAYPVLSENEILPPAIGRQIACKPTNHQKETTLVVCCISSRPNKKSPGVLRCTQRLGRSLRRSSQKPNFISVPLVTSARSAVDRHDPYRVGGGFLAGKTNSFSSSDILLLLGCGRMSTGVVSEFGRCGSSGANVEFADRFGYSGSIAMYIQYNETLCTRQPTDTTGKRWYSLGCRCHSQ